MCEPTVKVSYNNMMTMIGCTSVRIEIKILDIYLVFLSSTSTSSYWLYTFSVLTNFSSFFFLNFFKNFEVYYIKNS